MRMGRRAGNENGNENLIHKSCVMDAPEQSLLYSPLCQHVQPYPNFLTISAACSHPQQRTLSPN